MKAFITFLLVITCHVAFGNKLTNKTDKEIEALLIGNWFVSSADKEFLEGNAISSYSKGHYLFFVAFADPDCQITIFEAKATWTVKNKQLIITIESSTIPQSLPKGKVIIDNILSIDNNNKVLMSIKDNHYQLRTKHSTCAPKNI